jgi:hypothetical protein
MEHEHGEVAEMPCGSQGWQREKIVLPKATHGEDEHVTMPMQLPSRTFPWSSFATAGWWTVVHSGTTCYSISHKKSVDDKWMEPSPRSSLQCDQAILLIYCYVSHRGKKTGSDDHKTIGKKNVL